MTTIRRGVTAIGERPAKLSGYDWGISALGMTRSCVSWSGGSSSSKGAMGTLLQAHGLSEEDYRGERLKGWPREVKGNHELLNLSRPDVVEAAHREYLAAGAASYPVLA